MFDVGAGNRDLLTTDMEGEVSSTSKTASRKNKYRKSYIKCFGVDLSPDNIAVAMVYFVQGVLGLARLAVSFYLKDDLHLDPAEVFKLYIYGSVFRNFHLQLCLLCEWLWYIITGRFFLPLASNL